MTGWPTLLVLAAVLSALPASEGRCEDSGGAGRLGAELAFPMADLRDAAASPEAAHRAASAIQAIVSGESPVSRPGLAVERRTQERGRGDAPAATSPSRSGTRVPEGPWARSSFDRVWSFVSRQPVAPPYPRERVSFWKLATHFLDDARRTLSEHSDLRPDYPKLIRPNGIALAGTWEITEPTSYTGLFARGASVNAIARASVFSNDTHRGRPRAFGLAVKLFPPSGSPSPKTANVFLIDDNAGTRTEHFTNAALTTHPKFTFHAGVLLRAPVLLVVDLAQSLADKSPGYRQLYPVAEAGLKAEELAGARSPSRLLVRGAEGMSRVAADDFREELDPAKYPGGLRFDVFASDGADEPWRRIGRLVFHEGVVSREADRSLHFPHPPHREGGER